MAFGRLFARVLAIGAQVVSRAVFDAYKQTVAKAAQNPSAVRGSGMSLEEACQILNVDKSAPREEIVRKYEHLFKLNDKARGGSFYLQSKIVRARERFEIERKSSLLDNNSSQETQSQSTQ